jgi:hypothetical protein
MPTTLNEGEAIMRRMLASLVGLVVLGALAPAQAPVPARLRWAAGQVLLYRVENVTEAAEAVADSKSDTKSVLKVTKRWRVASVDAAGTATLQLSLASMFQERTAPSGDVLRYDSDNPDKSTPELKAALSRYLNTPLATIRVDAFGRVVEVREAKSDAASFENELPFVLMLPAAGLRPNDGWERAYKITLPPPLGTGEKYDAIQKYRCKALTADAATVAVTTELKAPPKSAADAIPLWQMMPEGEIVYDVKNGRMHSAKLTIRKELKDHQGPNSSSRFTSTLCSLARFLSCPRGTA